jgi:alkaline phosphatase D
MNRRKSIKALALSSLTPGILLESQNSNPTKELQNYLPEKVPQSQVFTSDWRQWPDMDWVGPQYWGNRLQDWRIRQGKAECLVEEANRTLHCLTCQLGKDMKEFETSVVLSFPENNPASFRKYAGFRLGAKGKFDDYRSAAVFGQGLDVGVTTEGILFIGEMKSNKKAPVKNSIRLTVQATPVNNTYRLQLSLFDAAKNSLLARLTADAISNEQLSGNIALVSHVDAASRMQVRDAGGGAPVDEITGKSLPASATGSKQTPLPTSGLAFSSWEIKGGKLIHNPAQAFGPICFAQYTLHQNILKLTAQLAPVEAIQGHKVYLQIRQGNTWKTLQESKIDPLGRTAHFRIENWDSGQAVPYRVLLGLPVLNGMQEYDYQGTIASQPTPASQVKVAVFSCNCDYGFPDAEVAPHVAMHNPHLAVFLGDQFYESTGGFSIQTSPLDKACLDYLRKWYMFGWSYREVFRHIPCAIIPDDHDVYHGNVWGEAGKHAPSDKGWGYVAQDQGGYKMPPEWVNMVQRTQTGHLPDPYDATPVKQGINVYYTNWNYGGISFAILEDRKFKSAPQNVLPKEARVMNGFIQNPDFDVTKHRDIEADLLGERQLTFLQDWASDWKDGVMMKAVLSQTNFCTVATLPKGSIIDEIVPRLPIPRPGEYVEGDAPTIDMDSNGWPQKGRDEALRIMRKCYAFHIAGDQHLASTVQYGVDEFGDAGYAFAGPALNNLWPRRWWPGSNTHQPLPGKAAYTGNFLDGFGNRMTVHAVANPHQTGREPAIIYDRATGYGIVTFDKNERTITIGCWPRYVNPQKNPQGQYAGWPLTIPQQDNYGRKPVAWLPRIRVKGLLNPVVDIVDESRGELVYSIRMQGGTFQPKVFAEGRYTIRVSEPDKKITQEKKSIPATRLNTNTLLFTV